MRPKGDATPVEQVLCDYFARSYQEAALQTAEEIARATGVSKATVVRFASKLGFENFSHLRKRLQQIVAYDLSTVDRVSVEGVAAAVQALGAANCVLTSDAGQRHNPYPGEALRIFAQQLHELGVAADDVYTMVRDNPARLLGLSGSGTP